MSVVANLPAPAVTAPHAFVLSPHDGAGGAGTAKLFFHPFFPLLHLMHLPHFFLHKPFGLHGLHKPFGHHGLGGFGGLGGLGGLGGFHHGLGGLGGIGGFPFRALPPQVTDNSVPGSGGEQDDLPDFIPASGASGASPQGTTRLAPVPSSPGSPGSPLGGAAPTRLELAPPFVAYISPDRKVIPASAFPPPYLRPAYLPAFPSSYAGFTATSNPGRPAPAPAAAPAATSTPAPAPAPDAPTTPAAPTGPAVPDVDVITTIKRFKFSAGALAAMPPPLPLTRPGPPAAPLLCECAEEARLRVELDHSQSAVTPETPGPAPGVPAPQPVAPPPTMPPTRKGRPTVDDSSPELPQLPQQRDKAEDEEVLVEDAEHADHSDSRVLDLADDGAAATTPAAQDEGETTEPEVTTTAATATAE